MLIIAVVLRAAATEETAGASKVAMKVEAAGLVDPGPDIRNGGFLAAADLAGDAGRAMVPMKDPLYCTDPRPH